MTVSQTYLSICGISCRLVKQKLVFWQNIGQINADDQECCKHIIGGRKSIGSFCKITDIISGGSHERFIVFAVL
jgi:hypothetical protein